jgi:hypothetical protein
VKLELEDLPSIWSLLTPQLQSECWKSWPFARGVRGAFLDGAKSYTLRIPTVMAGMDEMDAREHGLLGPSVIAVIITANYVAYRERDHGRSRDGDPLLLTLHKFRASLVEIVGLPHPACYIWVPGLVCRPMLSP